MLIGNSAQPGFERRGKLPIATPCALYAAAYLSEREHAEENLILRSIVEPCDDAGVCFGTLSRLGDDVRIQ